MEFVHRSNETLQRAVKTLSGAFALNQLRTIPFGRTLSPLKTTSVNRKGFPENSRDEKILPMTPYRRFWQMWKTFWIMWKSGKLLWKSGKLPHESPLENSFFRACSHFAPKGAIPLLLTNWKGYGFFRARLRKITDFFFNCVHISNCIYE